MSWTKHDQESNEFAKENIGAENSLLFGRVTFEMMASYWPTEIALQDNPAVARYMNKTPKYIVTNTLARTGWQNTTFIHGNIVDEIRKLKQQPGLDMIIFGSGKLVAALTENSLIDGYSFMVNPLVLGQGTPLFEGVKNQVQLDLVNTRTFKNGNVLLNYQLKR